MDAPTWCRLMDATRRARRTQNQLYDYVDVEEMRTYMAGKGDLGTETQKAMKPNAVGKSALGF